MERYDLDPKIDQALAVGANPMDIASLSKGAVQAKEVEAEEYRGYVDKGQEFDSSVEPSSPSFGSAFEEFITKKDSPAQASSQGDASGISVEQAIELFGKAKLVNTDEGFSKEFNVNESTFGNIYMGMAAISPEMSKFLTSYPVSRHLMSSAGVRALESLQQSPEDLKKMEGMSYGQRIDYISQRKKEEIETYYAGVMSSNSDKVMGSLARALLDPTVLAPAGQTFKVGAAIGAGLGGLDAALNQRFNEGELDAKGIAIAMGAGGLIGGAIAKGGKVFSDWLDSRMMDGAPVTVDDVTNALKDAKVSPSDIKIKDLADEINTRLNLAPVSELRKAVQDGNKLISGDLEGSQPVEELLAKMARNKDLGLVQESALYKQLNDLSNIKLATPESLKVPDHTRLGGKSIITVKGGVWKREDGSTIAPEGAVRASEAFKALNQSIPTGPDGTPSKAFTEALGGIEKEAAETGDPVVAAVKKISEGDVKIGTPVGSKMYTQLGRATKDIFKPTEEEAQKMLDSKVIANLGLIIKPETFLRKLGGGGREVAERLRRSFEITAMEVSDKLVTINKALNKGYKEAGLSKEKFGLEVARVMRSAEYAKTANPAVREVARVTRKELDKAVARYERLGLITKEQASAFRSNKDYFPRVYDHAKLSTESGKREFIKGLMDYEWTETKIDRTIKSLLGEKWRELDGIVKQKNGTYKLVSKALAERIYAKKDGSFKKLSHHMEKDRTLDLPDDFLENFLINDPHKVAERYLMDTFKRAVFAEHFGADGEVIKDFALKLKKATGRNDLSEKVISIYRHAVSDPADAWVNRTMEFMARPSITKSIISGINSAETLKLVLSPIVNSTQAVAGGSILLTRQTGSFSKAFKVLAKGIHKTLTHPKVSHEASERAAAAFEQTIMKTNAEMGAGYQKFSTAVLQACGFVHIEKLQRQLAYNMGKALLEETMEDKAKVLAQIAKQGPGKHLVKELNRINSLMDEMGLDTASNKIADVNVNEAERFAQRFSNKVNFVRDADQLPLWSQSPYFALVTKFKSFAYWWGGFIMENALEPAMKGNFKPLMTLLGPVAGLGMLTYEGKDEAKKFFSGIIGASKKPEKQRKALKKWADGLATVGGFGLFYDLVRTSSEFGVGMGTSSIIGPGPSDVYKGVTDLSMAGVNAIKGDFEEAGRRAMKAPTYFLPPIVSTAAREAIQKPTVDTTGGRRRYSNQGYKSDGY